MLLAKQGIDVPELTNKPEPPERLIYLWEAFVSISSCTKVNFSEIKAWSDMTDMRIKAWELSIIMMLERVRINHG